jgi:amino acid adenylation domain-containing protein
LAALKGLGSFSAERQQLLRLRLKEKGVQAPVREAIPRRPPSALPPSLSFAQQRLWLLDRLEPGNAAYNIPVAVRLAGCLETGALLAALAAIVRRHEALRTTFGELEGRPFQLIAQEPDADCRLVDLTGLPERARTAEAVRLAGDEAARPFDLERGPLLRATLLYFGGEEHVALLTMHHIISDGWSCGVLLRELAVLYEAFRHGRPSPLPPLPIQYADFSEWQRAWLSGEVLAAQLGYWRQTLSGAPATLDLPTDHLRPAAPRHTGSRRPVTVPAPLTARLRDLCRREDATPFMLLLAAFSAVLGRAAQDDGLVVGTPIANRNREEIEGLIGFFVNTLALRIDLSGDVDVRTLLSRARTAAHGAYAHQDLPFERIVEELAPERLAGRNPLFQVMFALQNTPMTRTEVPGLALIPLPAETGTAKFDLSLSLTDVDGRLEGDLEYSTELFDATTIDRLAGHLVRWLDAAVAEPAARIADLPLLSVAERHQMLVEWNDTEGEDTSEAFLHELFEAQVEKTPGAVALIVGEEHWTYGELNAWADRLAGELRELGVGPEDRVGLCSPRDAGMVAGLLAILKAGGAYVPLDPAYPPARLEAIVADAGVEVVGPCWERRLPAGRVGRADPSRQDGSAPSRNRAAYLIYTSGSTGEPKGVVVRHASAVAMVRWALTVFPAADLQRVLAATSIAFDISVFELFVPLSMGGAVVLAENALALPDLPAAGELTLINTVPSAMAELVRAEAVPASVRTVNLAGEALPRDLVDAVHRLPGVERVFNLYGPSEDTVYSTAALLERGQQRPPAIGRPIAGTRAYVLDRAMQPVPIGIPGELYLAGAGLARGYLGRPEATAEKWVPAPSFLAGLPSPGDRAGGAGRGAGGEGSRLYRTGDLVRFRPDGSLDFLGRIDHQVKVRGFRIEPGEIETALRRLPGVRAAAVLAQGANLVAFVAGAPDLTAVELREGLAARLPVHMVPSSFALLDALPLSPNGKVDRKALARLGPGRREQEGDWIAPRGPVEEVLAAVWSEVLGRERIGARDSFFELGGHSLLAMRALSRVRSTLGADLPLRVLFEAPTIEMLAQRIEEARGAVENPAPPLVPVPRDGEVPLSFAQERMWFMDRLEPGSPIYNVPEVLRLGGPLRVDVLERCLRTMFDRHESLRTRFGLGASGRPVQIIEPELPVTVPLIDLSGLPAAARVPVAEREAWIEVLRPFDLARGPVLRGMVLRLGADDHVTVLSRHHIVSDGWSMELFSWEMSLLYQAFLEDRPSPLPPLPIQYADFAHWQREWLQGPALEPQLAYWRQRLAGAPPLLQLPTDRPRPPVQTYPGEIRTLPLTGASVNDLRALARREGATLFMILLAAFKALIVRYTGREDVVLGTPVANRHRAELETLIGFFANTLVLRTDLRGDPSFRALLGRVRETALGAYEHQDLPFERLVEELKPKRDLGYTPLFQVMFVQQGASREPPPDAPALAHLKLGGIRAMSRFDLEVYVLELRDGVEIALEYNTDLFDRARMDRLLGHFKSILDAVLTDLTIPLSNLPLLTAGEQHQILVEWGGGKTESGDRDVLLHELVLEQAARTPEAIAIVAGEERWIYRELMEKAGELADSLRNLGIGPEDRVGVCAPRTPWMVAALLAVLKVGAAYVPLDPAYPQARREKIVADARPATVLLGGGAPLPLGVGGSGTRGGGDGGGGGWAAGRSHDALAYLIYTSGSTGEPKGVTVTHASAVALVRWAQEVFPPADLAGVLAATSIAFDLSVFELFVPLASGGTVILAENVLELPRLPAAGAVTLINTVPSAMAELVRRGEVLASVRTVNLAGEPLPRELAEQIHALPHVRRLLNLYGPSEDTTYSTFAEVPRGDARPPSIGRAITGARTMVLDRSLRPVPIGVPGELCLGGAGLARGYLGRPAATAERWVPDPFAPLSGTTGARLYRTGDLARWRANGELEFLGRIDDQVKIRGFRIEPGEIETVLRGHPGVRHAAVGAVIAGTDPSGELRLIAWFVGEATPEALRAHLAERLPASLIPAVFVSLDAMPLTPHGKLDRRRLPDPGAERALERQFVAPRDAVESALAQVWEEILGIHPVGVTDSFFDLGGHSLAAVRLIAATRRRFGRDLPLAAIFRGATVESLATALRGTQDSGPILFCIHGAGGSVLPFADLARELGEDQSLIALEAKGLTIGEPPQRRIDEMAATYLEKVREAQPHGPYRLLGYSMGGKIAHEMARRLREEGEEVALLAILDIPAVPRQADLDLVDNPDLPEITLAHREASRAWTPGLFDGRILLLIAAEGNGRDPADPALGWGFFAAGGVESILVPGGHYTMLAPPHASSVAKIVRRSIDRSSRRGMSIG